MAIDDKENPSEIQKPEGVEDNSPSDEALEEIKKIASKIEEALNEAGQESSRIIQFPSDSVK